MTPYVGCDYARAHLDAFVDAELPMGDQVLVESHLRWCTTCAARVEDLRLIGDSMRREVRSLDVDEARAERETRPANARGGSDTEIERALSAMQAQVLAQAGTEYELSYGVRLRELFADMRLLWPALGATAAVALSVGVASGVWRATSTEQPASLAAMIESLANPGSDRNPLRLDGAFISIPRVVNSSLSLDGMSLDARGEDGRVDDDAVVAVATVVTRDGKIGGYTLLESGVRHVPDARVRESRGGVDSLLHAVRQSRFAPAQGPGGRVVAVNMVWLFARTTVKGSMRPLDLGTPLTGARVAAPRAAAPPPVGKPEGVPPEGEEEPMPKRPGAPAEPAPDSTTA